MARGLLGGDVAIIIAPSGVFAVQSALTAQFTYACCAVPLTTAVCVVVSVWNSTNWSRTAEVAEVTGNKKCKFVINDRIIKSAYCANLHDGDRLSPQCVRPVPNQRAMKSTVASQCQQTIGSSIGGDQNKHNTTPAGLSGARRQAI